MQIIPNVKKKSEEISKLKLPISIDIEEEILLEINKFFNTKIFMKSTKGFSFRESKDDGYDISLDTKIIKFNNYKDKVNALFTIAQFAFNFKEMPNKITDCASFEGIGASIDIARHFFNLEELKKLIIMFASVKYNKFHLHMTDDQGGRIEIKKYPKLTKGELALSQKDIKELVRFATLLGVDIIPEFGIPGHVMSLLAKLDEPLACDSKRVKQGSENEFGISKDVLCLSNPKTEKVILEIYNEIANLFPFSKIHIGGDECPTDSGEKCKSCQAGCSKNKKTIYDLHKKFIQKIIDSLNERYNKKVIAGDDMQDHSKYENITIEFYRSGMPRDDKQYLNNILEHNSLIVSPDRRVYYDYTNDGSENEDIGMDKTGFILLKDVYEFDPFDRIDSKYHSKVLGSEASLGTEKIKTFDRLVYQAFPRSFALSEVLWGERTSFEEFVGKIDNSKFVKEIFKNRFIGKYK